MKVPTIGTVIPPRDQRDWITTSELIAETGITYRQADYWIRTGLLAPLDDRTPGSGHVHRFATDQADRARAIKTLIEAGLSLQTIRQDIDELLAAGQVTHGGVTFVLNQTGDAA